MRNFISVDDVADIDALLKKALACKQDPYKNVGAGTYKRLGCIFFNPSMRTRISTQIAAQHLGMDVIVFNAGNEGWMLEFGEDVVMNGQTVEHIKDAAPVLGKYFDILAVRSFPSLKNREEDYSELYIRQFIRYAGIPVISLESTTLHPLQSLADLMTIHEFLIEKPLAKERPKIVLTWAPHVKALPQCVANSFAQWVNAWGKAEFVIAHPPGYELKEKFTSGARITHDREEALRQADFVYVKNWSSYSDYGKMISQDPAWMPEKKIWTITHNARLMHCLPVRRNVELSDELLDGPMSIVTKQAANRVWAAQAVLEEILASTNKNPETKS